MTATAQETTHATPARADRRGYPAGGLAFDWTMLGLSALFFLGLWIDGWAHFHGQTDNTFFTPWHAVFYGAFALVAFFLLAQQVRHVFQGYAFTRALPQGYWLSLLGVGVFAAGGLADMVWHMLFGIEGGSEALTSPSHIVLALGMLLIFTGPVRAAWARWPDRDAVSGWRALGPLLLSMTLLTALVMFFISYSNPVVHPFAVFDYSRTRNATLQDFGVTGILLNAAVLSMVVGLLVWRWKLPPGAFTVLFGVSTALLTVMSDFFVLIVPAVIAGVIVDALYLLLRPAPGRTDRFTGFMFAAPFVYYALYMAAVLTIGTRWSIHVWAGAAVLSGVLGVGIALLLTHSAPAAPKTR